MPSLLAASRVLRKTTRTLDFFSAEVVAVLTLLSLSAPILVGVIGSDRLLTETHPSYAVAWSWLAILTGTLLSALIARRCYLGVAIVSQFSATLFFSQAFITLASSLSVVAKVAAIGWYVGVGVLLYLRASPLIRSAKGAALVNRQYRRSH